LDDVRAYDGDETDDERGVPLRPHLLAVGSRP
jgi:hypothetical protein